MMMNQANTQNNFIARIRQITRCCSFCRNQGHNIKNCSDERLTNFQTALLSRRDELREVHSIDLNNKIGYFEMWLQGQNYNLVKGFALRFCKAHSRHNLNECVLLISTFIWGTNTHELIHNPNNNAAANNTPDYIPLPISIMDVPDDFDLGAFEFLVGIRDNHYAVDETRKFKIDPILCLDADNLDVEEDCNICFEKTKFKNMVTLNCNHKFCGDCVSQTLKKCIQTKTPNCAMCRTNTDLILVNDYTVLNKLKENIV